MPRAIRDDQKEERRQAILEAAWNLFQENSYEAVNVIDVARKVDLAKGTIYLYFKTKEELFLAILEQQFQHWFDEADNQLQRLGGNGAITEVAALIANSLGKQPALTRLFAITHIILEQNVGYDTVLHFKRMLLKRLSHTGALLEACLPMLQPGQGARLLLRAYALVIGLQNLADPAPMVKQALQQEPDLSIFEIDFASEFLETLIALMQGLSLKQGGKNR